MKKRQRKIQYTFYLDEYMADLVKQIAEENHMSQGELVRRALEKEFNNPIYKATNER
jgi:predicted secreted Zn-dependent protease